MADSLDFRGLGFYLMRHAASRGKFYIDTEAHYRPSRKSIVEKMMMVEELPQGALPRYERDPASTAFVIPNRGVVPDSIVDDRDPPLVHYIIARRSEIPSCIVEGDEVQIPTINPDDIPNWMDIEIEYGGDNWELCAHQPVEGEVVVKPCPDCNGTGEYVGLFRRERCGKCGGKGKV